MDFIQLRIPHPYVLLFGSDISLFKKEGLYTIKPSSSQRAYHAAHLNNYNITQHKVTHVFVLKRQPFAFIPVNLT